MSNQRNQLLLSDNRPPKETRSWPHKIGLWTLEMAELFPQTVSQNAMVNHDPFEIRSIHEVMQQFPAGSSLEAQWRSEASQFAARRVAEEAKVALLERIKVWLVGWDNCWKLFYLIIIQYQASKQHGHQYRTVDRFEVDSSIFSTSKAGDSRLLLELLLEFQQEKSQRIW